MLRRVFGWVSGLSALWLSVLLISSGGAVTAGGVMAYRTWDWVEHDNDFCMSCHLMAAPFEAFAESAHREMGCKACHKPTMLGRSQMALAQVIENPEELTVHAEVPNEKCASCHVDGDPDKWALIAQTAGHRVHFESADTALAGLQCVKCHSSGVHEFAATDQTCAQSGCHTDVKVTLGRMGDFTIHCAACHGFNAPTSPDQDPAEALRPADSECLSCHVMRVMVELPDDEPHGGVCATCHNPHTQEVPRDAVETCATSGCHENPEELSPFHRGVPHAAIEDCATCHVAHDFRPVGTDCLACHQDIYNDGPGGSGLAGAMALASPRPAEGMLQAAGSAGAPAAMAVALSRHGEPNLVVRGHANPENDLWSPATRDRAGPAHAGEPPKGHPLDEGAAGEGVAGEGTVGQEGDFEEVVRRQESLIAVAPIVQAVADTTFRHASHRNVDCTSCHSTAEEHGTVTVTTTTDCRGCHHTAPVVSDCAACHTGPVPTPGLSTTVTMTLSEGEPRVRELPFSHEVHASTDCQSCHTEGVDQPVPAESCASCHQEHHGADPTIDCAQCHLPAPADAHTAEVHTGCGGSGCHTSATAPAPPRNRLGCLACHQDQRDHEPDGECVECHVLPPIRRGDV